MVPYLSTLASLLISKYLQISRTALCGLKFDKSCIERARFVPLTPLQETSSVLRTLRPNLHNDSKRISFSLTGT